MIRKRDKHREGGRGAEKCVSEHWVTPLLNLSASKVSPQGRGSDGWMGTRGGESLRRNEREGKKGERLHTVQSEVRKLGQVVLKNL